MELKVIKEIFLIFAILLSCLNHHSKAESSVSSLDPEEGKYFIVSAVFELAAVPRPLDRISIFSKLQSFGRTTVGYGLSLRGYQTSVRPQIYWSAGEGEGGFFTFGNFDFRPRHRYSITLVSRPGEFMSLYVQELNKRTSSEHPTGESISQVFFLGGHELKGIRTPRNVSQFNYKSSDELDRTEHAKVTAALVASPEKLKDSIDKLKDSLVGAPDTIATSLSKNEIKLWEVSVTMKEQDK